MQKTGIAKNVMSPQETMENDEPTSIRVLAPEMMRSSTSLSNKLQAVGTPLARAHMPLGEEG